MKKTLLLMALVGVVGASEALVWELPKPSRHGKEIYTLSKNESAKVTFIDSQLKEKVLPIEEGGVALPRGMFDNYHALVAEYQNGAHYESAITYIYRHGRPSNVSPVDLTNLKKAAFEIVPDPLAREHDRYTGSKSYRFWLKQAGQPVGGLLTLQSANGTTKEFTVNAKGYVDVTLPNDFKNVSSDRSGNMPSIFTLHASYQNEGKTYESTLTQQYWVNPNDYWRSEPYGVAVALLGFGLGVFFMRRTQRG